MIVKIKAFAGMDEAMEGMRLAYNSKRTSDNIRYKELLTVNFSQLFGVYTDDYKLLLRLIKKGDSHGKVARMIQVWLDITAPRFWWTEFDTYKIGTVATSESTIHTILKRTLVSTDFEDGMDTETLEKLHDMKLKEGLHGIKRHLPESFLQRRIVNTNYQTLRHIYFDRKNHVLPQWKVFLNALDALPFVGLIKTDREENI